MGRLRACLRQINNDCTPRVCCKFLFAGSYTSRCSREYRFTALISNARAGMRAGEEKKKGITGVEEHSGACIIITVGFPRSYCIILSRIAVNVTYGNLFREIRERATRFCGIFRVQCFGAYVTRIRSPRTVQLARTVLSSRPVVIDEGVYLIRSIPATESALR